MSKEEWRDVPGYEGMYQASSLGRVRSLNRTITCWNGKVMVEKHLTGTVLRPSVRSGYEHVCLSRKTYKLHRIVASAFLGLDPSSKQVVNHLDGNSLNNEISNLEVTTQADNIRHAYNTGLNGIYVSLDGESKSLKKWAEAYGLKYETVWKRLKLNWTHEEAIKTPLYGKRGEY